MEVRTYGPITLDQINSFLQEAQNGGLQIVKTNNTSGTATGYGSQLEYVFSNGQVTLTLVYCPLFFGMFVWGQIESRLPQGTKRIN